MFGVHEDVLDPVYKYADEFPLTSMFTVPEPIALPETVHDSNGAASEERLIVAVLTVGDVSVLLVSVCVPVGVTASAQLTAVPEVVRN